MPLALALLTFVSGCAMTSATDPCTWDKKISPSRLDTDETLRQIYEHNQNIKDNCGRPTSLTVPGAVNTWAGFPSTISDPSQLASGSTTAIAGD